LDGLLQDVIYSPDLRKPESLGLALGCQINDGVFSDVAGRIFGAGLHLEAEFVRKEAVMLK